mgnify:CR=1 FL=1
MKTNNEYDVRRISKFLLFSFKLTKRKHWNTYYIKCKPVLFFLNVIEKCQTIELYVELQISITLWKIRIHTRDAFSVFQKKTLAPSSFDIQ